jgi:hypothetical protein
MRLFTLMMAGTATVLAALTVAAPAAADPPIGTVIPPIEGYVWGSQPATPSYTSTTGYEHNSHGGAVQIQRSSAGTYQVRFVGMAGIGGVAHVSAYGAANICVVSSWGPSLGDELVNLRCFTAAGVVADSKFIAHVTNRTDGVRGYLWSNDATPPAVGVAPPATWSYDSTGGSSVVRGTGVGAYEVELGAFAQDAAGAWTDGALRVTAYGATALHCQVLDPAAFADPDVLRVRCYNVAGLAANSRFALSYTRDGVPASATVDTAGGAPVVAGWHSPGGVAPTVTELGEGDYLVSFPAAGSAGGHAFAGIMSTPPMFCVIQSWTVQLGAERLRVRCYQPGVGAPNPAVLFTVGFLP